MPPNGDGAGAVDASGNIVTPAGVKAPATSDFKQI
jgi:hypothetical protein